MSTNKALLIIISALIVVAALTQSPVGGNWESKIDTQGAITVKVTPAELSPEATEWKFDVGLNTHSVELNQDMTKNAVLIDSYGKEYRPLGWEGAPPEGHHREGFLIFKSITPTPKFVELRILNIDAPVRSFVWDII